MLLLTLGMAQAPRLCMGDGQGGACQPDACICVAACSCHEAHHREVEAAEAACCAVEPASCHEAGAAAAASACHGPKQWPHFAPADKHWDALAAALPPSYQGWPRELPATGAIAHRAHRPVGPPEKVPRPLV